MGDSTVTSRDTSKAGRLDFIDLLRGIAVVLMILWHTADSWVRPDLRVNLRWTVLVFLGGLAAPLFTTLAGVSAGLRADKLFSPSTTPEQFRANQIANIGRGLEIFFIGYALRFQMWFIDGGGATRLWGYRVYVPGILGLAALIWGAKHLSEKLKQGSLAIAAGVALYAIALWQISFFDVARVQGLLRVDVLQAIGSSLVILAIFERALGKRPMVSFALGITVALLTDAVQKLVPGPLPLPLAALIARWPEVPGVRILAMFPWFPWLGYVLIGRGMGAVFNTASKKNELERLLWILGPVGLVLSVLANETLQWHFGTTRAFPFLVIPFRMTARIGNAFVLSLICLHAAKLSVVRESFLRRLGQSSLLVYWVHLEIAYGIISGALQKRLSMTVWFLDFALLTIAMIVLVYVKQGPWAQMLQKLEDRRRAAVTNAKSA